LAATTGPPRDFTEADVRLKSETSATTTATPISEDRRTRPQPSAPVKSTPPAPVVGSLLVRSTPLGARVVVDGREYGRTPVTVGNLSRGVHKVRVIRDGYVPDDRQVTVTSAQRAQSMTVRLAPERVAPVAAAVNRPAAPSVFLDGQQVGTTPLVLPDVAAGEHALHLDHDGYRRWASTIRIVTTEKNRVTASLDR
jgi:hypothetical protein